MLYLIFDKCIDFIFGNLSHTIFCESKYQFKEDDRYKSITARYDHAVFADSNWIYAEYTAHMAIIESVNTEIVSMMCHREHCKKAYANLIDAQKEYMTLVDEDMFRNIHINGCTIEYDDESTFTTFELNTIISVVK